MPHRKSTTLTRTKRLTHPHSRRVLRFPEFCKNHAEKAKNVIKVSKECARLGQKDKEQAQAWANNQFGNEMWRCRPVLERYNCNQAAPPVQT
mmetsp:Transcript_5581/g.16931  ORF Transcript_5581/g.16931 Transcript_5581/m.16931 type:complete len:92 (+) Transcript_5581:621-896(+)